MSTDLATGWDPDKCACRWGEQPCAMCLPVLDARFRAQRLEKVLGPTVERIRNAEKEQA